MYVGMVIGAISVIFLQPYFLTPTELGFTRNLYNVSYLLSIAVPLGLPNVIMRAFPSYKAQDAMRKYFFGFILLYFAVSAIITLVIFLLFSNNIISLYTEESELFIFYFFCVIPYSLIIAFNSSITGFGQAAYKSTVPSFLNDVFSRVCVILVTVMYYYKWISFDIYVLLYISIYAFVALIIIFYLKGYQLISLRIDFKSIMTMDLKSLIPFGLISCVVSFTSYGLRNIDSIFLGMNSLSNVAVYSTALFLALFIEVPLNSIERISYSKIVENFATGNLKEIEKIYSESVKYLLVFGGLIFLGMNACSGFIFEYLPPIYSAAVHLVLILSFGCLVNISTGVNNAILFYSNHFKTGAVLLVVAFSSALFLYAVFIPRYGITAAAYITAGVGIVYNFAKSLVIYRIFGFQPYTITSLKIVLLILAGFCILMFLPALSPFPWLNIIINGGFISAFYTFCIYRLNIVPEIFRAVAARLPFLRK